MTTNPVSSQFAAFAASTQRKDSATDSNAAKDPATGAATQQMFLQLLVAQLKNQDPSNPTDGTQFVAQLAQFSQLEQTIAIRQNTDNLKNLGTTTNNG